VVSSGDVAAEKVVPVRVTRTNTGDAPVVASWAVLVPCAPRHCTTTPLLGVTKIA
jgi:hypothetical protein